MIDKLIAAAQDLHAQLLFDVGQIAVIFAAQGRSADGCREIRQHVRAVRSAVGRWGQSAGGQSGLLCYGLIEMRAKLAQCMQATQKWPRA